MQYVNKKYEFSVKICCPFLTTSLSGSPVIQDGKLVGAVTHVILLRGASVAAWCYALCSSFDEPPRSNLRSLADKQACLLASLDYV